MTYYLPKLIKDKYIPSLAKIFENDNELILQKILVNADISINEEVRTDNWNGGQYFHDVILTVPEALYFEINKQRERYEKQIGTGLNNFLNINDREFVENVVIDFVVSQDDDWRENSGLLIKKRITVSQSVQNKIWAKDRFRIFLSHKDCDKVNVAKLKTDLAIFGIDCFVAHEDIEISEKWADTIEKALFSMDALVAIMTETFHNSYWTDHEIGVAYGREVPLLAIKMGTDPYGIIGRFQAMSSKWDHLAKDMLDYFLKYPKVQEFFVASVENCFGWETGNKLAEALPLISKMDEALIARLEQAYKNNSEVRDSFGFNGKYPGTYGAGLFYHIKRWAPNRKITVDNVPNNETIIPF